MPLGGDSVEGDEGDRPGAVDVGGDDLVVAGGEGDVSGGAAVPEDEGAGGRVRVAGVFVGGFAPVFAGGVRRADAGGGQAVGARDERKAAPVPDRRLVLLCQWFR